MTPSLEIVTLGRFEVHVRSGGGSRVAYAPASAELLKFLLCRSDLYAYNADVKVALWPSGDDLDDLEAARLRDGNFASARARLDEWLRAAGAEGVLRSDGEGLGLDRACCRVDAVEADMAYAAIVRGELRGAEALAALEAYDRPFLPGDVPGKRGSNRVIGYVLGRRHELAQRALFATAAALRTLSAARAPGDPAFAALVERAHAAREVARRDASPQLVAALEGALALAEKAASARTSPPARATAPGETLAGRERELEYLREVLGDPQRGLVLVVEGPAGVGTTAVVRAAARDLAARGERAFFDLTADPGPGGPGGSPEAAVLVAAEAIGPVAGAPALQPVAAGLAGAIPQLAPWFGDVRPEGAEPLDASRRAALLAHAVRLLDRVRPALVFVDRRDLTDPAAQAFTGELLHQIGRYRDTIRLAVVLTARPGDGQRRTLGLDTVERFRIDPLDERAARSLATKLAPRGADAASLAALSDGLPANLVYLARAGGSIDGAFAEARLAGTSPEARAFLGALARAGRPIDFASAVAAAGGNPGDDRWFDALEELQAGGWLDVREGGYAVRETLVARSLLAGQA